MSIGGRGALGTFAVGAIMVVALAFGLCGSASAHAIRRAGRPQLHRLQGWRLAPGRPIDRRARHRYGASRHQGSSLARVAVVGGEQLSVEQAPWQVALVAEVPVVYQGKDEVLSEVCGGAILDEERVLTAAHCMFNPLSGSRIPAEDLTVIAGSSNFQAEEATRQDVAVASFRVHPHYAYNAEPGQPVPDDVAVLELGEPLAFKPAVKAIALVASGSLPQEGTAVSFTGFGEQSVTPAELNGGLYALGMAEEFSANCGGEASALFVCASTSTGSICVGDSGSGLTVPGLPATLIGIANTVEVISGEPCRDGAQGGFANIAAPEIHDFIDGDESPPTAPRGGDGIKLAGASNAPNAEESMTCSPGEWSGEPAFTYSFINSKEGQVLQSGSSPIYHLTQADTGRTIICQVEATNAGGTGMRRTDSTEPVFGPSQWSIEANNRIGKEDAEAYEAMLAHEHKLVEEEEEAKKRALAELIARENTPTEARKAAVQCVVPSLRGDTLTRARRALSKAHCRLGKVREVRTRKGTLVVAHQQSLPGERLASGARVGVTLGPASHKRH